MNYRLAGLPPCTKAGQAGLETAGQAQAEGQHRLLHISELRKAKSSLRSWTKIFALKPKQKHPVLTAAQGAPASGEISLCQREQAESKQVSETS